MSAHSSARFVRLRRFRAFLYRRLHRTRIRRTGTNSRWELNDALLQRCDIELSGPGHTLIVESGARLWGVTLRLIGENNTVVIGPHARLRGGHFLVEDRGGRIEIGASTTMFSPMVVCSEGGSIRIGRDCLIAYGLDVRNSDGHSVLDATTRQRVNPAADTTIADHVWIGNNCQIMKGVTVGTHSIVASRAVVTKEIPPHTLAAGLPAKIIRENVDWDPRRL
jgi:acetyltransferase-like isoleucine patch superfamily enzyme